MTYVENLKYQHQCIAESAPTRVPSWSVIVDGVIVWTGGYGRAKREADKRGGTLRPSETMIMVNV